MAVIVNEIDKALQATFPRYTTVDGVANFTWVKYADDAAGTNMSDSPTGKAYIGFAFNKTTATESTTPSDYTWTLVRGSDGTSTFAATVYLQQSAQPAAPTGGSYNFGNAALTAPSGWSASQPTTTTTPTWAARFTFTTTTNGATVTGGTWSTPVSVAQSGGAGSGTPGSQTAIAYLYQWGSVAPSAPAGTSTLTWSTGANSAYTGSDGWAISPPTNPGFPGWRLYVATVSVTAAGGTTTSTVSYSSAAISAWSQNGQNGAPGVKAATATAYQWGLSAPTATGTATYTWATAKYDNAPATGWSATKGSAPGNGYTLYEASVRLVDSSGATTSSIDWTTASIAGIAFVSSGGGAGAQGASAKRAYVLIAGTTLNLTPTTSTVTGNAFPATGTWGETNAWQATPPTPVAGQSVFQADGIFDPVANQTVWNVPYLSNLKVGNLSTVSANTGDLTFTGTAKSGNGKIQLNADGTAYFDAITIGDGAGGAVLKSGASLAAQTGVVPNIVPRLSSWPISAGGAFAQAGSSDSRFLNGEYASLPNNSGVVMLASPALGIKPGYSYTVGFDAYCTGAPRTLNVDVYNGTIDTAGSAVTLTNTSTHYSFTESNSDASMPSAWLRVFCTTQGSDVVVSNVKVAIGAKDTAWCDNVITKANISTFMQAAAIGLAFIDTASIGQLSALSAYLGAVDIGPNGHIASGQTDYNVGNGLWIGGSNAPRMSMRTANGNTFLCDPANNVLSMNGGTVYGTVISGGMVSGTTSLPKPSVTGTGPITSTGANGNRSWNLSVSASGGSGTFTYSWVFGGGTDSVFRMSGNTSSSAVTVSVSGTNNEYYALCICVVTDSNGLSSYFSVSIDARFGTPV